MNVLLDTCVWGKAAAVLRARGHDVVWAGDWDRDPGDEEILAIAHREGRVLVTLDKDFVILPSRSGIRTRESCGSSVCERPTRGQRSSRCSSGTVQS